MYEKSNIIVWEPGEVIYQVGDDAKHAYLIMEGSVIVYTDEGLRLNQIGVNEILGETSLLLDQKRTVTAIASSVGTKAARIPKQYFDDISARDKVTGALIRKIQLRLIDSNKQSNELAVDLDQISKLIERQLQQMDGSDPDVAELLSKLKAVQQKLVFDRHLAHYPGQPESSQSASNKADEFG